MVLEYFKKSWSIYKKNFWTFIGAFVILYAVVFALVMIGMFPIFGYLMNNASIGLEESEIMRQSFTPQNIAIIIIMFALSSIASVLMSGGIIRMFFEGQKKKVKLDVVFKTIKKKWKPIIGAHIIKGIIVGLFLLVVMMILSVPIMTAGIASAYYIIPFMVTIIATALFSILFVFPEYAVVIDNKKAVDSVKKSFRISSKNYVEILVVMLISVGLSFLVSFIPFVGSIVNMFLISPLVVGAYTMVYVRRRR